MQPVIYQYLYKICQYHNLTAHSYMNNLDKSNWMDVYILYRGGQFINHMIEQKSLDSSRGGILVFRHFDLLIIDLYETI